jgi:fucose 4-O-acetylase-like acetyltransferase
MRRVPNTIAESPAERPTPTRTRDLGLDALRGITILLVIFSHALQDHPATGTQAIWDVLWYVDMPLFTLLAGFAFGYGTPRPFWKQVGHRARLLLVPYVAWGIIGGLATASAITPAEVWRVTYLTLLGQAGPWFLLALFVFEVILLGMRKISQRPALLLAMTVAAMFAAAGVRALVPGLDETYRTVFDIQKYLLFYVVGYLACVNRADWMRYARLAVAVAAVALPLGLAYKLLGGAPMLAAALDAAVVPGRGVLAWALGFAVQIAISLSACMLAFAAVRRLDPERLRPAAWVGTMSLGIYLVHIMLRGVITGPGWANVGLAFALGTVVSVGVTYLITRVPLLDAVLLGGRKALGKRAS